MLFNFLGRHENKIVKTKIPLHKSHSSDIFDNESQDTDLRNLHGLIVF